MGTNNVNQDLVCENISVLITFFNLYLFKASTCVDKRVRSKTIFLISQPKHMLWVLKRTVSLSQYF